MDSINIAVMTNWLKKLTRLELASQLTIGLLPPAGRTTGARLHYRAADLERLRFVRRCRDVGFAIEQVRDLVAAFDNGDRECSEVRDAAKVQLEAVRAKLSELRDLETSLAAFVVSCDNSIIGGVSRDCCIIDDLSRQQSPPSSLGGTCGAPMQGLDVTSTELKRRR